MTTVTLPESGFASIPADVTQEHLKQNSGGWHCMLRRLETAFTEKDLAQAQCILPADAGLLILKYHGR